jgi:hypothetical protein
MSREWITEQIDAFQSVLSEDEQRLRADPENPFIQATIANRKEAINDFAKQLKMVEAEQASEILELRFIGPLADNGSLPLEVFLKVAAPLVRAWKTAAHRLKYGRETSKASKEIKDELNLRLAGLAYGSTRIILSGNGTPDLAGENLLQATLTQTFRLLNSDSDSFYDALDAVGVYSARNLSEAVKEIRNAGLSADFVWHSLEGMRSWEGRTGELDRITGLIEMVSEPEIYEEVLIGEIAGILDTGRLQIRTPEGKITVRFPLSEVHKVQELAIRRAAALNVATSRYFDTSRKSYIYSRELKDVLNLSETISSIYHVETPTYPEQLFYERLLTEDPPPLLPRPEDDNDSER